MPITKEDVKYAANLAKLGIDKEEEEIFTSQLQDILKYIEQINEIDTDNIDPTFYPVPLSNVFRKDNIKESLKVEEAVKNAPESKEGQFVVPKIIED